MTKALYPLLLFCLFSGFTLWAQSDSIGTLEIEFTDIRSDEGQIAINISSSPKGYPREPALEIQFKKDEMQDGVLTVYVDSLIYNIYAISVMDDTNCDMEMEMFLGFPKEGYGFSLNPEFKLRAPRFKDCTFEFNEPHQKITIHMKYHRKNK